MAPNEIAAWEETYILTAGKVTVKSTKSLPETAEDVSEKTAAKAMLIEALTTEEQRPGQLEAVVLGAGTYLGASFLTG